VENLRKKNFDHQNLHFNSYYIFLELNQFYFYRSLLKKILFSFLKYSKKYEKFPFFLFLNKQKEFILLCKLLNYFFLKEKIFNKYFFFFFFFLRKLKKKIFFPI
jgi:hypothetical protein